MKKTYSILLTLIMTIGFISGSVSEVLGQYKYKDYILKENLIIGKKYDGKISDAAIARIDAKMEEIKALIEKLSVSNDTLQLRLNYIKDVNNLKSIETLADLNGSTTDTNTLALLEILKKYPYIDVMVTVVTADQESADKLANSIAMELYNGGQEKERMRVNGRRTKVVQNLTLILDAQIQLVPSKEMIDKAIKGTL